MDTCVDDHFFTAGECSSYLEVGQVVVPLICNDPEKKRGTRFENGIFKNVIPGFNEIYCRRLIAGLVSAGIKKKYHHRENDDERTSAQIPPE